MEIEIIDIGRSKIRLQRVEDVRQRHLEHLSLDAVDVGEQLWAGGVVNRGDVRQDRLFAGGGDQVLRRFLKCPSTVFLAVLEHEL